jgi:hypothetical protein
MEGEVLRLMQAGNSAWTSESSWRAAMESQRLSFDIARKARHRELEQARVEVETRREKRRRIARRGFSERKNGKQK